MVNILYCKHYQLVKSIIMEFDKEDVIVIENAQTLLVDNSLELNLLAAIKVHYGSLPKYITTLEKSELLLVDAIGVMEKVRNYIGIDKSKLGQTINQKF